MSALPVFGELRLQLWRQSQQEWAIQIGRGEHEQSFRRVECHAAAEMSLVQRARTIRQLEFSADSFRFAYLPVTGDSSVIARVTSVQNSAGDAKAGIMIREALTPSSKMMGVYMLPVNTINGHTGPHAFVNMRGQVASSHNLKSQSHRLWDVTTVSIPYWLKIERIGNRITAYHSTDGASWSTILVRQDR